MAVDTKRLPMNGEGERQVREVERRVTAVNGRVMVRAEEGQVYELVLAAPADPMEMVAVAEELPISVSWIPEADLAFPLVEVVKLAHQLPVAGRSLAEEVGPTFGGDPRFLIADQVLHGVWI